MTDETMTEAAIATWFEKPESSAAAEDIPTEELDLDQLKQDFMSDLDRSIQPILDQSVDTDDRLEVYRQLSGSDREQVLITEGIEQANQLRAQLAEAQTQAWFNAEARRAPRAVDVLQKIMAASDLGESLAAIEQALSADAEPEDQVADATPPNPMGTAGSFQDALADPSYRRMILENLGSGTWGEISKGIR